MNEIEICRNELEEIAQEMESFRAELLEWPTLAAVNFLPMGEPDPLVVLKQKVNALEARIFAAYDSLAQVFQHGELQSAWESAGSNDERLNPWRSLPHGPAIDYTQRLKKRYWPGQRMN